ncbi:MAG: cytochrome ubiquinol oxidase subunit I, partial [Verrucomicrobiota bacterium]
MDVVMLSRVQFGLTSAFHYIYPPLSIGIGLMLVVFEGFYLKTRNILYQQIAKFWTKIFALTFALGVATGLVQLFGFGTNWANYSRFVGDVFGSALGAEGIFAFFF